MYAEWFNCLLQPNLWQDSLSYTVYRSLNRCTGYLLNQLQSNLLGPSLRQPRVAPQFQWSPAAREPEGQFHANYNIA